MNIKKKLQSEIEEGCQEKNQKRKLKDKEKT